MKPRTRARCVALQALYEIDMVGHSAEEAINFRLQEERIDPKLIVFIKEIVYGVWPRVKILDQIIAEHAPEWPLDQIATIDRNILRIALWELAIYNQTPLKVSINEAVELAKIYGSDSSPRFVNGVLGSLSLHENDIKQKIDSILEV